MTHRFLERNTVLTEIRLAKEKSVTDELEAIRRDLVCRGVHLRIGRNFDTLQMHISSAPTRPKLHEQFDPLGDMDGAVDAFWICGFNADGDLVHTQAASLLDLNHSTVAQHIQKCLPRYTPKGPPVVPSSIRARPGPKAKRMSGNVVYHGEMWLVDELRDQSASSLLTRMGILLAVREWQPDAVFGLMNWDLACQGLNMRIGYTHCEPMTVTWTRKDNGADHHVWMVYLEKEDIDFLIDLPAIDFARALANRRG